MFLLIVLLAISYGFYLLSSQRKAENKLFAHMSQVMQSTEYILLHRLNEPSDAAEDCKQESEDEREIRQCRIKLGGVSPESPCGPGDSSACVYSVCVDKEQSAEGGTTYETYIHASLLGSDHLCQAQSPAKGALGTIWSTFGQGMKGIAEAVWGPRAEKSVDRMSYEFCPSGGDCVEIYESSRVLEFDKAKGRIRTLVSGLKATYWSEDQIQNAMFLIAFATAAGMVLALGWLIGRKVGQFETQANRLRNRIEDQGQTAINDEGFTGELAEIAAAADKRMASNARGADEREAAARKIRERLMACAVQLGKGVSHNENALLARLNGLIDSIKTDAEKGRNVSPDLLKDLATATRGVRTSLEGLSKQLIRWSIGDFSESSDAVDIGTTLSDAITAVKATSKRELIWTESVPKLSSKTTQFGLHSIIFNLLSNAERHTKKNIEISAQDFGEEIEIVVEDDGAGFPPDGEAREVLLKWGIRAGMYADPDASGIGIGLALVADWLRGGDGTIELSTSPNWGGALVRIRVRCSRPAG